MGMLGDDISWEGAYNLVRKLKDILSHLGIEELVQSGKVLDIGCGDGKLLAELSKIYANSKLYGLSSKVNQALPNNPKATIKDGRFQDLPFEDSLMSLVLGVDILDYAEEAQIPAAPQRTYKLEELLKNTHRVLQPRGYFISIERFELGINFSAEHLLSFDQYFARVDSGKIGDGGDRNFYVFQGKE